MERKFTQYALRHADELVDLTCAITRIPAPSYHEEARAEFVADWLRAAGAQGVSVDEDQNVIWPCCEGKSGKWIVLSAHLDTVFGLDVPLEIKKEGDRLYCPGIGDDSANLAVMLLGARWLLENPPQDPQYGILFLATAAEEVSSVGSRRFLERFGAEKLYRFYSFDACYDRIYNGTVNIRRFLITARTPGGHALGCYGMPNAIEELAKVLCRLAENCRAYIAQNALERTAFNAGTICGGERSNVIAKEAELLLELRSDKEVYLQPLFDYMQEAVAAFSRENVSFTVEEVGQPACWNTVDDALTQALTQTHIAMLRTLGLEPEISKAATDCRYPMSKGVPSLCLGLCYTVGPHKLDEYLVPDSLPLGLEFLLMILDSILSSENP